MPWRPGQQASRTLESPYEDLPDHLRQPVHGWIAGLLSNSSDLTRDLGLELRLRLPDPKSGKHAEANGRILQMVYGDDHFALNLVELILARDSTPHESVDKLAQILEIGHSAYRVRDDERGLEMRVLPEVKAQVQAAVDAAEEAPGQHLAAAWNAAYGRIPEPERAYDRSIKAVEAALRPVVSPTDSRATLTKMILAMRDAPSKWSFVLADERSTVPTNAAPADGVQVVIDQMRLLAYGQKQRHGEEGAIKLNSEDEARAAVLLAVTLVQFCVSGALIRVDAR